MHTAPRARVGVVRPAGASSLTVIAELEARIVTTELERRLGPLTLDLRTDGPSIGPWQPRAHAAWPTSVDAVVDLDAVWALPLTALAARTVEPAAADVRHRMLRHLGVIADPPSDLDRGALGTLLALSIRPTDLWLIARAAPAVASGDTAVDALALPADDPAVAALDAALDAAVTGLALPTDATVQRLGEELVALRAHVAATEADARRTQLEAADRIDDLLQERAVLRERLERAELDQPSSA